MKKILTLALLLFCGSVFAQTTEAPMASSSDIEWIFFNAILTNNTPLVSSFLMGQMVDPNEKNDAGYTPVHLAIQQGNEEMLSLFIQYGANVNTKTPFGDSTILSAVSRGNAQIVQILIDAGAEVNTEDMYDGTPLMLASLMGYEEIVRMLIDAGGDVHAQTKRGVYYTYIPQTESREASYQIGQKSGEMFENRKRSSTSAIMNAVNAGHTEVVKTLVENGAILDTNKIENLHGFYKAIEDNNQELVDRYILAGYDVNTTKYVLLEGSVYSDNSDGENVSALMIASMLGRVSIVDSLLQAGATLNAVADQNIYLNADDDFATLHPQYALKGRFASDERLYSSPITCASLGGHTEIITLFINHDDFNTISDHMLEDALFIAKRSHNTDISRLLEAQGISLTNN